MSSESPAPDTHQKPSADSRFWATVAAQTAGVLLLFFIAIIFDLWNAPCSTSLEKGIHQIFVVAFLVFIGLVAGCATAFIPTQRCDLKDAHVNRTLFIFLFFDIPLLTFLVVIQGGFSRSVFTPLFFLIYIAYNAVEEEGSKNRKLAILGVIEFCMLLAWLAPTYLPPGKMVGGIEFLTVTDFSAVDVERYSFTNFLVASLSLAIYVVQLRIIRLPRGSAGAGGKRPAGEAQAAGDETNTAGNEMNEAGRPELKAAGDGQTMTAKTEEKAQARGGS